MVNIDIYYNSRKIIEFQKKPDPASFRATPPGL